MREQGLLGDDACMLDIVARLVGASWGVRARVCTDFFHRTTKALPPRSGLLNWKAPGTPEPHVFFPKTDDEVHPFEGRLRRGLDAETYLVKHAAGALVGVRDQPQC